MYVPAHWVDQVSLTPLLMMVPPGDTTSGTDLALSAYREVLEPKRLLLLDGDHFDVYDKQRAQTTEAAADGFEGHPEP
jgi:hypothetical protein